MKIITKEQVENALSFSSLIAALHDGFAKPASMPKRQVYALSENVNNHDAFAVLPAWNKDVIGVKSFTYFPNNAQHGFESLYSKIMLFSRANGLPLALVDGTSVTYWRTAAISALASQLLSRKNSTRFVLFGSGNLARYLIEAHLSVRTFEKVTIIARNRDKALSLVSHLTLSYPSITFETLDRPEQAVIASADVICCATGSHQPLFEGDWLSAGTHVDLLGNHHRDARECDTQSILKSTVFVDSRANVLNEAGELLIPLSEGVFNENQVVAELSELCKTPYVRTEQEITLFKSVGTALADLIAANLVYRALQ